MAVQSVANVVKSSLDPVGLDKMLVDDLGDVTITNDGATILRQLEVEHPAAKILVELAELQDEANKRGLPVALDATRVQLMMLIREDADHRIMLSTPEASAMAAASREMDEDFEMVPASRAKVKPSPKPKGYQNRSA